VSNATGTSPLLRDSRGELLRARTFSATSIHTPRPDDPYRTLCGAQVMLFSESPCGPAYGCVKEPGARCEASGDGYHQFDLTICAGDNPQLCKRCEITVRKAAGR
jgi:hypothetical protein